jgi:hypothetical protein
MCYIDGQKNKYSRYYILMTGHDGCLDTCAYRLLVAVTCTNLHTLENTVTH